MNLSRSVLITHKGCMDGSASAVLFLTAGGKEENIYFLNPSSNIDEFLKDILIKQKDLIFLVDISVSYKLAESINSNYIYLFDHHKSAISLNKFNWCKIEINNKRAGCKMFYDWLIKQDFNYKINFFKYKKLIEIVDDYDRWIKNYSDSDVLATLHNILGQQSFINRFIKDCDIVLTMQEQFCVNIENKKRKEFIKNKKKNTIVKTKRINNENIRIGFVLANNHQSKLGHAICEDAELNVDMAIMVGNERISMRSNGNCSVDLSSIAKRNGGGGHKMAAGCNLHNVLGKNVLELVMDNLKLE